MRSRYLTAAVLALACERSASKAKVDSAVTSSTTATDSAGFSAGFKFPAVDPSDPFRENIEAPDSSVQAWHFADPHNMSANTFFGGSYVRHPSGLFILWLDTATRATEEAESRRVHADSIVLHNIAHGEMIARYCRQEGSEADRLVGILPDTTPGRPRLAWILDPLQVRVRSVATELLTCRATAPVYDEADQGG